MDFFNKSNCLAYLSIKQYLSIQSHAIHNQLQKIRSLSYFLALSLLREDSLSI